MCGWRQALLGSNLLSAKTIESLKKKVPEFILRYFLLSFLE